jgi:hypothetical protein
VDAPADARLRILAANPAMLYAFPQARRPAERSNTLFVDACTAR